MRPRPFKRVQTQACCGGRSTYRHATRYRSRTNPNRPHRMFCIREVVLQYRLLQSVRERLRRRFVLFVRNELLQVVTLGWVEYYN